ncbi:MAG: hypothetical protein L0387_35930 [Acidobacteria bacterium]|nr:hypothetical protein [Acidobacteriota bacterium]
MSFKSELESLIAGANSSLQDIDSLLLRIQSWREVQGNMTGIGKEDVSALQSQMDAVRQRISASLQQFQRSYDQDQRRLSELEGELRLDLENVKDCAVDFFIKGQYRECVGLLSFLGKIQPEDENLKRFLDLSRRKQLESEAGDFAPTEADAILDTQPSLEHSTDQQDSPSEHPVEVAASEAAPGVDLEPPATEADDMPPHPSLAADGENDVQRAFASQPTADPASPSQPLDKEPQRLVDLEVKHPVAFHNETEWMLSAPPRRRPLVWAAAGLLMVLATALFWFSRPWEEIPILENQFVADPVSAEKSGAAEVTLRSLRKEAQELFDAGKLRDAELVCDKILDKNGWDAFAVALKEHIRTTLSELKSQTGPIAQREETTKRPPPSSGQSQGTLSGNLQPQTRPALAGAPSQQVSRPTNSSAFQPQEIAEQRQKPDKPWHDPLSASKRADALPPSGSQAESTATQVAAPPQINTEALLELTTRIQAQEFDQARTLLAKLESGFPGNGELKTLSDRLRAEEGRQQSLASSWVQKAEAALIAGHYVTPPHDNVLVYCNQALKADPRNQRASDLKKDIVGRAVAQARDWIQRGKFDAARIFYASMDYLAMNDNEFPYSKAELKQELQKLEFKSYPMLHEHKLGSCAGKLRISAYAVSYVPSGSSGDGFTESLKSIIAGEEGEKLRISYRDRTFRFHPDQRSSRENVDAVRTIYQRLIRLMADEKSAVAISGTKDTRR